MVTMDDLERHAEDLHRGVYGLQLFANSFATADIYLCGFPLETGALCEIAKAYSAGFDAALKMAKAVMK